jgi:CheY-like chemotaxis protein
MTRVLIVDDDPQQLRLLARVITTRQPGLSVVTANSGEGAIEQLRAMPVDLVLTDLQMPDTNGFGLVTWLLSHQPHVQVFTMTAYPDDEAVERLRALGSVECYTKPLDVAMVLERLSITLEQGMRGHVRNISLPSLLQLIEMERKTCTLTVEAAGRTGYLYISEGRLVDARLDEHRGDEAAISVAGWASPAITIINTCATKQQTVEAPMRFIIMEALRLSDEAARTQQAAPSDAPAARSEPDELDLGTWSSGPPLGATMSLRSVSHYPVGMPSYADAIAIVEADSGRIRTSAGAFSGLDAVAQLVARVYAQEATAVGQMDIDEGIQELVMTTARYWTLTRPLHTQPPSLALVVFDPERANVGLERLELDAFVAALQAWSVLRPP